MTTTQDNPTARTALHGQPVLNGAISVRELALSGKISVRGDVAQAQFAQALVPQDAKVPTSVGDRIEHDGVRVLCVGPDEWLLHLALDKVAAEIDRLQHALTGQHAAVVDVSDYYTVLELSGVHTRDVLAKLTPLDVTAEAMPTGANQQTRMAKCSVLLMMQSDHCARLQVRWSHAEYLRDYLEEAAREYNA
ncbi:MAG: sarcosine oxidase subunit gamma family protein [Pseudomonadota bacterium]